MHRIYLDYNSTSIMDKQVVNAMSSFLTLREPCNPSSIHMSGRKARSIMEQARQNIAKSLCINAYKDDLQIIFTSSGTEANNLAIYNFQEIPAFLGATEHVSILESRHENKIIIPVNKDGIIDEQKFCNLLNSCSGKKLVSIMLANNETGVIQDIKNLSNIAKNNGAIIHCDASQALCRIDVNFHDLGIDLMTISSHKCGGPSGAAALIAKKHLQIKPMINGGKQEQGIRAGTENLLAIYGFGVATENYLEKIKQFSQIEQLRNKIEQSLTEAEIIASNVARIPNTSSIRMPGIKSEEQLIKLDLAGICVSAGSACSSGRIAGSHVLKAMGIDKNEANEIIRVSLGLDNTEDEINKFIKIWKEIKQ